MSERIGKECLVSMNELSMCQPRVGGMCHLTNYSIFSTLTFFICFQSGDEPYVCEAAKTSCQLWPFRWLSMVLVCRLQAEKPCSSWLRSAGPFAVAMVWNFSVLSIFRQQHTYKCVVKLDACRGEAWASLVYLLSLCFNGEANLIFLPPPSLFLSLFPPPPTPPLLKRHQ